MRETTVQLPYQTLAFQQGGESSAPSALASHIARSLSDYTQNGVPYDMEAPIMEGLLAMAQLQPLNPRERVDLGAGNVRSLLDTVLALHCRARVGTCKKWPHSLEEFGPHLLAKEEGEYRDRSIDSEWVAAVLVAAGANPWQEEPGVDLPSPVLQALQFRFAGLLDRFLDCPGAPTPQGLLETIKDVEVTPGRKGWSALVCPGCGTDVLKMLVARGLRLEDPDHAVVVLSEATPEAVAVLAAGSALPEISDRQVEQLMQAWTQRVKTKDLAPSQVQQMQSHATGRQANHETATAMEIARMLTGEWGKSLNLPASVGAAVLNRKSEVKRGPMAGRWSILAALAMSRIRGANFLGPYLWSVALLLEHKHSKAAQKWLDADCHAPPYKGSLSSAIGFDWRPGIAIDGVVALSVLGQQPDIDKSHPENNDQQGGKNISDFAAAAGIADVRQWAIDHAPSAAAFTSKLLRAGMNKGALAMVGTWRNALHRVPEMAQVLSPEQRLELLVSLTAGFDLTMPWSRDAGFRVNEIAPFKEVVQALFPGLDTQAIEDLLPSPERTATLAYRLIFSSLKPLETVDQLRQVLPAPSKEEFVMLGTWAKPAVIGGGASAEGQMKALLLEWELEVATPCPATIRTRGPRL